MQERKAKFSAEFQGQRLYHQDQGANSGPSEFPPVLWDLVLSTPSSSCYLCTGILLLHLPLICQGEAHAVPNPLRLASLAHFSFLMASLVGTEPSDVD